jgi:hypothetical protein
MNDFTKGELQLFHAFMYEFVPNFESYDLFKKIQSMIDNYRENVDHGHLTDKHIGQWAGYLIEEFPNWKELEKMLRENPEIEKVFIEMYKKGFYDCKTEGGTNCK